MKKIYLILLVGLFSLLSCIQAQKTSLEELIRTGKELKQIDQATIESSVELKNRFMDCR